MSVKISEMTPGSTLTGAELLEIVKGGNTRNATAVAIAETAYISVRAHGALGDGSTDDTTAVQAAIDAAETAVAAGEATNATVYFPSGTYILDPVYVGASNVRLLGEGRSSLLKRKAATVDNVGSIGIVNVHGTVGSRLEGCIVERLGLDGNKANITVVSPGNGNDVECLSFKYTDHCMALYCTSINSTSDGIDFDYSTDCEVVGCHGEGHNGCAVHFSLDTVRCHASGCTAYSCGTSMNRAGFDVHSSASECSYTDCHARDCYVGVEFEGDHNQATGCSAIGCTQNGIRVEGDYNSISGCQVRDTTANGVTLAGDFNAFTGGHYLNSGSSGIIAISGAVNNTIAGIVSKGNGTNGIRFDSGSSNNLVVGCQLTGNSSGISDAGAGNTPSANKV